MRTQEEAKGGRELTFRDPHTAKVLPSIEVSRQWRHAAFAKGRNGLLAVCQGDEVWWFDLKARKGALLVKQSPDVVRMGQPVPSPDGKSFAFPHDDGVSLFDLKTGRRLWDARRRPNIEPWRGVAFARGGKWLLALQAGVVAVLDARTGRYLFLGATSFWPGEITRSMAVSPDGRWLLTAASRKGGVEAWGLDSW